MAVDKSFVVKNGLEVNSDLIVADASTKKVGIASTAPRSTLDVRGGIAATDINITGIATIANLEVAAGDVNLGNLNVTGFSTLGGLSVDQLKVTGFTTFSDISYDEISGRNLTLTGIATIPTFVGLTSFNDGVTVAGVSTITTLNVSGVVTATHAKVSGGATITTATVTTANITTGNVTTLAGYPNFSGGITVAGVSTFSGQINAGTAATIATNGNASFSGIVTASQFQGGGIGVGVGTTGGVVAFGATFFEFKGPGFTTAQYNAAVGIVTVNFQGGGGSASIGVGSTPGDAFTGIITAGNLWYNSGLGRLFIYYQDDNSAQWVDAAPFNVGIITQLTSVAFSTGTVAAPSLSFGSDSNTGFFAPADGSVAYSSNGAGIVTFNSTGVVATSYFGDGSNLTGIDATSIKDSGGNVKVQGNPNGIVVTGIVTGSTANFTGIVTASSFAGDGSNLTNLPAGLGTALSSDNTSPLNNIYYTDQVLSIGSTITVDPPNTAVVAYTQYANIQLTGDADLIIGDGDEFVVDILGIGTTAVQSNLSGTGGRILADNYTNASGTGAPTFNAGLNVTGVVTATSFAGNVAGNATGLSGTPNITVGSVTAASGAFSGNVSVGGTLSYMDVTNIDSVGIITAQQGIQVLANGLDVTGVSTFKSNVSIADSIIHTGDTDTAVRFPAADTFSVHTNGSEALRVDSSQRLLKGHTASEALNYTGAIQVQGTNSTTSAITVKTNQNDSGGPGFVLAKSRGSLGGNTVVQVNDVLGSIFFNGADGTDTATPGAEIVGEVDGTPGSNDMPGRLVFKTTPDGSPTPSERLRITAGGGFHFTNGELIERAKITAGKLSDNTNIDLENGMVHLFTTQETTTSTPNIRINSSTSLNSVMATGEMISVTLITTAAAGGYSAQLTIDGGAVTENWTGGSAPDSGGSSGVDIHAYTIIKTGDAAFTVVATQTKTSS